MSTGFEDISGTLTTFRVNPTSGDIQKGTAGSGKRGAEIYLAPLLDRLMNSINWIASGFDYASGAALVATFNAGEAFINGRHIVSTGTFEVNLEDDATNHIWLTWTISANKVTALGVWNATSDTPPSTEYVKIATVTTSSGSIDSNTDERSTTLPYVATPLNIVDDTSPQLGADLDTNGFDIDLGTDDAIFPTAAPSSDHEASGYKVILTAGENLALPNVGFVKSDGKVWKADSNGTAPAERGFLIALATISADASGVFALPGTFIRDDTWTWTVGNPIYLSETAGGLTQMAPATALVMGIATHADRMFFFPTIQDVGGKFLTHKFTTAETWAALDSMSGADIVEVTIDASAVTTGTMALDIDTSETDTVAAGAIAKVFIKEPTTDVDVRSVSVIESIVLAAVSDTSFYVMTGITSVVESTFTTPGAAPSDITRDSSGNLISSDTTDDEFSIHSGFTTTVSSTFATPTNNANSLTMDGSDNLISGDGVGGTIIFLHTGITSTIGSTFASPGADLRGLAFDGTNLVSSDSTTNLVYIHSGITVTVGSTFASPASNIRTMEVMIGGDLLTTDTTTNLVYIHTNVTSTVSSTFAEPAANIGGITSRPIMAFAGTGFATVIQ